MKAMQKTRTGKLAAKRARKAVEMDHLLNEDVCLKSDLSKELKISFSEVNWMLKNFPELGKKFAFKRRVLMDLASDNLLRVASDYDHKECVSVSKWLVQNFKSDLDTDFEAKDSEDVSIELGEGGTLKQKLVIKFAKVKVNSED